MNKVLPQLHPSEPARSGAVALAAADATEDYLSALFPPCTTILALPNLSSCALYIPAAANPARRWRAAAIYPGNRPLARMLRGLARGAAAVRLGRTRLIGAGNDWPLGMFLREVLPDATEISVLLKRADSIPRATIEIRDAAGRVLGYAKYAVRADALRRLEREHAVLSGGLPYGAPRVLKFAALGSGKALLLSVVPGRRFWPVLPPPPGLLEFFEHQRIGPAVPGAAHPWVLDMRGPIDEAGDDLFATIAERDWPVVVKHGDLMPSNLCVGRGGKFGAVDWEYGTCAGFPHLDLVQYILLILVVLRRQRAPAAAACAAAWLGSPAGVGVRPPLARALTRLAALDLWVARADEMPEDTPEQRGWRAIAAGNW